MRRFANAGRPGSRRDDFSGAAREHGATPTRAAGMSSAGLFDRRSRPSESDESVPVAAAVTGLELRLASGPDVAGLVQAASTRCESSTRTCCGASIVRTMSSPLYDCTSKN